MSHSEALYWSVMSSQSSSGELGSRQIIRSSNLSLSWGSESLRTCQREGLGRACRDGGQIYLANAWKDESVRSMGGRMRSKPIMT